MQHQEFETHRLNGSGLRKAQNIGERFDDFLTWLETDIGDGGQPRLMAIVRTKLEEACFFAKKAMASDPQNQE